MKDIWKACNGSKYIVSLQTSAVRVVESQEQVATMALTKTVEEQVVLEQLLEEIKPPLPEDAKKLNYLIATPFRYPPLPYGSRFGYRYERSIFYGSLEIRAVLAECAYYRLVFISAVAEPFPKRLITDHTTFLVKIDTTAAVRLERPPFHRYRKTISDSESYTATQQLGTTMRQKQVAAFTYYSARDIEDGINVGIFEPAAIASPKPQNLKQWACQTDAEGVSFTALHKDDKSYRFPLSQFLVRGNLPSPAV